jgi:Flp pilus assembly protein TadB
VAWEHLWWRIGLVVAAVAVGWAFTGWPAAGVIAGATAGVVPMLAGTRRRRDQLNARSEALAVWAEMLRDTIAAHAGLREAIAVTARVAPPPIRAEVQALSVRAEREPLTGALRRFTVELADPVADLIVAALVIAADRQAHRLAELLSHIATAAREQAAMRLRVETGRARTYASSRALVAITFGLAVTLLLFSPTFMEPYDTATGQIVLIGIGALFAGALWSLVLLGRPAVAPRLLAGVEHDDAEVIRR